MPTREHDCDHCRHWRFDPAEIPQVEQFIAAIEGLGSLVQDIRQTRGLSLREVEKQCGVNFSTIHRAERGIGAVETSSVVKLLRWVHETAQEASDR